MFIENPSAAAVAGADSHGLDRSPPIGIPRCAYSVLMGLIGPQARGNLISLRCWRLTLQIPVQSEYTPMYPFTLAGRKSKARHQKQDNKERPGKEKSKHFGDLLASQTASTGERGRQGLTPGRRACCADEVGVRGTQRSTRALGRSEALLSYWVSSQFNSHYPRRQRAICSGSTPDWRAGAGA